MAEEVAVIGHEEASLARRQILAVVETEGSHVSECTCVAILIRRSVGLRAVLDDYEAMLVGDVVDTIHVRGEAM